MVRYFIRLDDLCHNSNLQKWQRFFDLFDRFGIKPIIAVIPANKDPKLLGCGSYNRHYWSLVRKLQANGYIIGMHGYDHVYVSADAGLLRTNNRAEFAGMPIAEQGQKLTAAARIFEDEGVSPQVFIAPAHSLDRQTLAALRQLTNIRIISDGLLPFPYRRFGFNWLPVQLAETTAKKKGTWTFNYHPETCTDAMFQQMEDFIRVHWAQFARLDDISYRPFGRMEKLRENYLIHKRSLKEQIKNVLLHRQVHI
jgi:peptidoglycan/xylan/chitin deacetylase (PgdA/CDA1 family)